MTMLLSAFPKEYDLDVTTKILEGVGSETPVWQKYYRVFSDPKFTTNITNFTGFGAVPRWHDGKNLPLDEALKIGDFTVSQQGFGLGFRVTRDHDHYGQSRLVQDWGFSLGESAMNTLGLSHAGVLNNGTSTTFAWMDDKTLFSTTHTTVGNAVRANRPASDVALTADNLDALYVLGMNWVNKRGLRQGFKIQRLIVPPALWRVATQLAKSTLEPSTTDNEINVFNGLFEVVVDSHLSSTTAWSGQGPRHGMLSNFGRAIQTISYLEPSSESMVKGIKYDNVVSCEYPDGQVGTSGA